MSSSISKKRNAILWTVQIVLALLFLFAGGSKLAMSAAQLKGPIALPIAFLRFIGVAELCGALGLVLPWVSRIRPVLTPLAACGLVVIMIGATVLTAIGMGMAPAIFPAVVGTLAATVAYHRGREIGWARALPAATLAPQPS